LAGRAKEVGEGPALFPTHLVVPAGLQPGADDAPVAADAPRLVGWPVEGGGRPRPGFAPGEPGDEGGPGDVVEQEIQGSRRLPLAGEGVVEGPPEPGAALGPHDASGPRLVR